MRKEQIRLDGRNVRVHDERSKLADTTGKMFQSHCAGHRFNKRIPQTDLCRNHGLMFKRPESHGCIAVI